LVFVELVAALELSAAAPIAQGAALTHRLWVLGGCDEAMSPLGFDQPLALQKLTEDRLHVGRISRRRHAPSTPTAWDTSKDGAWRFAYAPYELACALRPCFKKWWARVAILLA
jgi:hypothetical protein